MANGDVQPHSTDSMSSLGSFPYLVQNNTASSVTIPAFNPGEPVAKALATPYVTQLATSKPVSGTDYLAGISADTSTETVANDGLVHVTPVWGKIWRCAANVTSAVATQALYNALVGNRVLFNKSAANNTGIFTVLTSDSTNNGLVIEYLDVTKYPGQIAFSFRGSLRYNA